MRNILILGASDNPQRYSFMAFKEMEGSYNLFLVNPFKKVIEGREVFSSLSEVQAPIDIVTVYLSPDKSGGLSSEIIKLSPRRVIFNPGSENSTLERELTESGIEVEQACTLVLLKTNQF